MLNIMKLTHIDAERRYNKLREQAIRFAQSDLDTRNIHNLKLTTVTSAALQETKKWFSSSTRKVNWDWIREYGYFKFSYPKRFEIALWQKCDLISISLGRPTYNGCNLRLDVIEARPKDLGDRPSVFDEILLAYGVYARMIGATGIRIMNPINNEVKAYYESYGYKYIPKGDYLYREVI